MWVIPDFGIWVIFSQEKFFGGGAKIRMSFGDEFCNAPVPLFTAFNRKLLSTDV
jgi:hypothetical protein